MEGDQVDWGQPDDAFAAQLASARDALLAARTDPSAAVVPFEPIVPFTARPENQLPIRCFRCIPYRQDVMVRRS